MDLLKIATAGSVDDGKSTLIGRLLYETNSLKEDQLEHIKEKSERNGFDFLDFSLATDGLLTEREQGITIDVSHIYFSTPRRRFVIADSPGHVEYTRNMITGASNAQTALILVDARKGITEQTRRHFYITRLLGIRNIVLCVNKMDLVQYDQNVFSDIVAEFSTLTSHFPAGQLRLNAIPLSALKGENIARKSAAMPWYPGDSLLSLLENELVETPIDEAAVLQVQYVLRPRTEALHDYRAYLGKLKSGILRTGDTVTALPSGISTRIRKIEVYGQEVDAVQAGDNCSLLLEDELDISRGDTIAKTPEELTEFRQLSAQVCWMDRQPLTVGKKLWLQHGSQRVQARVSRLDTLVATDTYEAHPAPAALQLNDIGALQLQLAKPIFGKLYTHSKVNGAFILIDESSFTTAAVGFIQASV